MSDFNRKPVTAEVRALVHEVVDRLLDYNETVTTQKTTGNKPTFWVEINGYNSQVLVGMVKDGFPEHGDLKDVKRYEAHYSEDKFHSADGIKENLGEILTCMEEVYAQWHEQKGNKNEDKQN